MPELPEVEGMARLLCAHAVGRRITAVERLDPRLPDCADLAGARLEGAHRRAKILILDLGEEALLLHPRMTGQLRVGPDARAPRLRFHLEGTTPLVFDDPRRFGTVARLPAAHLPAALAHLGPEPWPIPLSGAALAACFFGVRGPIKPALLDQHRLAGVGNIGASEGLFRARIAPTQPVPTLSAAAWSALAAGLWAWVAETLTEVGADPITLLHAGGENRFLVYDRAGEPCFSCGTRIAQLRQAGRSTFLCPGCQGGD